MLERLTFSLCAVALITSPATASSVVVINGDFESDGGPFTIPVGWVPFGEAKYEGKLDRTWAAQVADAFAQHEVGLYQVIPHTKPGTRYRLTADVKSGNPQLPVRIGLVPTRSADPAKAIWSNEHNQNSWRSLSLDVAAQTNSMTIVLQMRNVNREYQLLQAGMFDNVRLTPIADEQPPSTPTKSKPAITPAHDVYANLSNLWSLAWPKPGVRTFLAGTHDPSPEGNADFDRIEGPIDDDGETWSVLKSLTGPGAVVRIWMTNFARDGQVRIYVDDKRVVDSRLIDFFGTPGIFHWPLTNKTSGGWMSYTPIPFTKSARILVKDAGQDHFYWQITHQKYEAAHNLRPFTDPLNATDSGHLQHIRDQWGTATLNPKPPLPGTRETSQTVSIPADEAVTLWSQTGSGMVDAFWIDVDSKSESVLQKLRLEATWDNAPSPQLAAPLGLFCGVGYGQKVCRGLLFGMAPPDGAYCYFPMPFKSGARIVLRNNTDANMEKVRFRIRWVPLAQHEISPLRFRAIYHQDDRAGEGKLYIPLEVPGRGHFVGLSGALAYGNVEDVHFLEGDEYIWVDGESKPSTAGTGTEDYFTCGWYFNNGPITLAPIGASEVNRSLCRMSAYRLHIPDWVPFDHSFKLGLEVGDAVSSREFGQYATVAYYYLQPNSTAKDAIRIRQQPRIDRREKGVTH